MGKFSFREIVMKLLCLLRERRKLISLTRAHRKDSQWTKEVWSFWPNYMPWIRGWNPWRRSKETWMWWTKAYNLCSEQWRRKKLKGFDDNRNSSSAENRRQRVGMNKTISYLSETVAALKESNREMNKSNAELLAKLMSISQRLSSFERDGTFVFVLSCDPVVWISLRKIIFYLFFSKVNQIEPKSKVRFSFKVLKCFYFLHFMTRSAFIILLHIYK